MVQILRDQMRDYQADVSGAIRTGQVAQNVGEWNQVTQSAFKIGEAAVKQRISDIMVKQAQEAGVQNELQKRAEQADADIQATQYGKTAHNATVAQLDSLAERFGTNSDKFKREAYNIAERNYAPQIEGMTSERGKVSMQEKLRTTKDYIDTYAISKRAKQIEATKAQKAADQLAVDFGNEAYRQGTLQSYGDIQGVDEYVKFVSKKEGQDKDSVRAIVDKKIAISRMLGVADTDIMSAATAMNDERILKDYLTDRVNNDPETKDLGKEEKAKVIDTLLEKSKTKEVANEQLREIVGSQYINKMEKFYTDSLKTQKVQIQRELALTNPKSAKAKELKELLEKTNNKIENIDEDAVLDLIRRDMNGDNSLSDTIKRRYSEFKQQNEVGAYNTAVMTWAGALNADPLMAQQAKWEIWASENGLIPGTESTKIGEWEGKTMSSSRLTRPIEDEVNVAKLASDYKEYLDKSSTVRPQMFDNYEGTMAMNDALNDLINTPDLTPIQAVAKGYNAILQMYKAPLTEDQQQTFINLVSNVLQDRAFGDMMKDVLQSGDRYYPDTSWMENAGLSPTILTDVETAINPVTGFAGKYVLSNLGFYPSEEAKASLPKGGVRRTDVDNVTRMMQSRTQKAINNTMHQMLGVANLPKEMQLQAMQQINNDFIKEKKAIYDDAVKEYGIDLNYLDQELATKGHAYTQVGFRTKEYLGRSSDGLTPMFKDVINPNGQKIQQYILELLGDKTEKQGE